MSIFERIQRLARAELGAMRMSRSGDRAADAVRDAASALSSVRAGEARVEQELQQRFERMDRIDEAATAAARRGDDEAALALLRQRERLEADVATLQTQRDEHRMRADDLADALDQLRDLAASRNAVPSPPDVDAGALADLGDAGHHFDEVAARIDGGDAAIAAMREVDALVDGGASDLEARFQALAAGRARDREAGATSALERLHARMNDDDA